jgi:hypothetical protein
MASSNPAVAGVNGKSHCCKQEKWLLLMLESGDGLLRAGSSLAGRRLANRQFEQTKCKFWGPGKRKEHTERGRESGGKQEEVPSGLRGQSVFCASPDCQRIDGDLSRII